MAQFLTSSTARIGFIFLVDGVETTASTSAVTVRKPDGTAVVTAASPTLQSGSVGTYYYDVSAASIGSTTGTWSATWTFTYGALTLTQTTRFTVGTSVNTMSLRQIRRDISKSLRDYWAATSTAIGTSFQVIDTTRLYQASGYFARSWVRCITASAAANVGLERQAGSFDSGIISLAEPFTSATAVGDKFDIHRRWSPTEYRESVNSALAELHPHIYLPVVDETLETSSGVTDYDLSSLAFPVSAIGTVEIETLTDRPWAPISAYLDPDHHTLRLDNLSIPGGKKIRLTYESRIAPLVNESDIIELEGNRLDAVITYLKKSVPAKLFEIELANAPSAQVQGLERLIDKWNGFAQKELQSTRMRRLPTRVISGSFGVASYPSGNGRPGDYLGASSL